MSNEPNADPFQKRPRGLFISNSKVERLQLGGHRGQFIGAEPYQEFILGFDAERNPGTKSGRGKLKDFLAVIEETDNASPGLLYHLKVGGSDVVSRSRSIGKRGKIPREEIEQLRRALEFAEKEAATNVRTNRGAKDAMASFKLPNPEPGGAPAFFRTWGPPWSKKLVILWGATQPGVPMVPWRTALDSLGTRARSNTVPVMMWFVLLPLLICLMGFAGVQGVKIAKTYHCRSATQEAKDALEKVKVLSIEVQENLSLAVEASGNRDSLKRCEIKNNDHKKELVLLKRLLEGAGKEGEFCPDAKRIVNEVKTIVDSEITPKVEEIDKMMKDLCGLARSLVTQLSEGRQTVATIRQLIRAAELALEGDAELILKPSATALADLETMTSGMRGLFDEHSLDSSSSRKMLEACDPAVDATVLRSDIESLESDVVALKEAFRKFNIVLAR